MNKKIYLTPAVRIIDLVEEGMIAASETLKMDANQNLGGDGEFSQKKEQDLWGNEDIWK